MDTHKWTLFLSIGLIFFTGCNKALVIENVNYTQYVESVLIPDDQHVVTDVRNNISFSIQSLIELEGSKDVVPKVTKVRLIRNADGFYFLTADQFKKVYVLEPKKGELKLVQKIPVSEIGIHSPVFNWRAPYVELLSSNEKEQFLLTEKGIVTEEEGKS